MVELHSSWGWGGEVRAESFKFFDRQGFNVMGACYYDAGDLDGVREWIAMKKEHRNIRGYMYTTWERNYDLLPDFLDLLSSSSVTR